MAKAKTDTETSPLQDQCDKFNAKNKVGSTLKFKDSKGDTQSGKIKHEAQVQGSEIRIWIHDVKEKLTIDSIL